MLWAAVARSVNISTRNYDGQCILTLILVIFFTNNP